MVRVRFAPSPSGSLHVGNARTALFNWLFARQNNGTFILRIEDTDIERVDVESERMIFEDLEWLGLEWDEGPLHGGPYAPYRQSQRLALYRESADQLLQEGKAYFCFCPPDTLREERAAQLAARQKPKYSGRCRGLSEAETRSRLDRGEKPAVRFRVPSGETLFDDLVRGKVRVANEEISDLVLLRSDGRPAYNFAVVVDDAHMEITHVIRGEDHISNTPAQMLLYHALGIPIPQFAHLALVVGPDGKRLSKRHGHTGVGYFREAGFLSQGMINYLALLGWSPADGEEIADATRLTKEFRLKGAARSSALFDVQKLRWVNRSHLRGIPGTDLISLARPYFEERGWLPHELQEPVRIWFGELIQGLKEGIDILTELPGQSEVLFCFDPQAMLRDPDLKEEVSSEGAISVLRAFLELSTEADLSSEEGFSALTARIGEETGQRGRALFHPIRLALTSRASGPELAVVVPLMEKGRTLGLPTPVLGCQDRVLQVLNLVDRPLAEAPPEPETREKE